MCGASSREHQFDALRQVAYYRIAHRLFVIDQGIGQIARERDRGGEWQTVLPSHDAFRRPHGVALFHDARGAADHHACDVRRLQWLLSLKILDGLDHGLMRDMGRIGFERGRLDGPVSAQPIHKPVQLWLASRRR